MSQDLGVRLSRLEEAALAEGRPLDSYEVPEPSETPAAIVKRWTAWAKAHELTRLGEHAAVPFDTMPDRITARWWAAYLRRFGVRLSDRPRTGVELPGEKWIWTRGKPVGRGRPVTSAAALSNAKAVTLQPAEQSEEWDAAVVDILTSPVPRSFPNPFSTVAAIVVLAGPARAWSWFENLWPSNQWSAVPAMRGLVVAGGHLGDLTSLDPMLAATLEPGREVALPDITSGVLDSALPRRTNIANYRQSFHRHPVDLHAVRAVAVALSPEQRESLWQQIATAGMIPGLTGYGLFAPGPTALDLAMFGAAILDAAVTQVCGEVNREDAATRTRFLAAALDGPGAVAGFLRIMTADTGGARTARAWLLEHPSAVAAFDGELATAQSKAYDRIVAELLLNEPELNPAHPRAREVVAAYREEQTLPVLSDLPSWWSEAAAAEAEAPSVARAPAKPPASMPRLTLRVAEHRLAPEQATAVVMSALRSDPERGPRPLVAAVTQRMRPGDRDRAAGVLLDAWVDGGANTREARLLAAAGFLGGEGLAGRLAMLVRGWVAAADNKRATVGMEALAANGTDAALQGIAGVAGSARAKKVRESAEVLLDRLAQARGLGPDDLGDRVVPDLGFDARGVRGLTYGPRSFRVSAGADAKPRVFEVDADGRPAGKARTGLPPARGTDDTEAVRQAKAEFAIIRKQLADTAKVQSARWEMALATGREWVAADHARYLAAHPVAGPLARALVWRSGDALFRIGDDGGYVDVEEEAYAPAPAATVTLAHPLELSGAELVAWREHLQDYELGSPVDQLDRLVLGLSATQAAGAVDLAELPSGTMSAPALLGVIQKLGWRRGEVGWSGLHETFRFGFRGAGVTAVVQVSGMEPGYVQESDPQSVVRVVLAPIEYAESGPEASRAGFDAAQLVPWSEAPALVVSEVRRAVALLGERMG